MEDQAGLLVREEAVCESVKNTGKKKDIVYQRRKRAGRPKEAQPVLLDQQGLNGDQAEENHGSVSGVSPFDHSVENYFRAMDKIDAICGEETGPVEEAEMNRLSEMVTFLSEWRHFKYKPKTIRFASQTGASQGKDKDVPSDISLSQFSSATVPKVQAEGLSEEANSTNSRNDFVFYAGGCIWALDWCPRPDMKPNALVNREFIAVSAHPPDSAYHKLGARLSGRGMVQIWSLLNNRVKEEDFSSVVKPCKKPRKIIAKKEDDTKPKRPRGRPRKHPVRTTAANLDSEQAVEVLAIEYPDSTSNIASVSNEDDAQPKKRRRQHRNEVIETASSDLHCQSQPVEVLAIEYPGCGSNVDENLVTNSSSKAQSTTSPQKRKLEEKTQSLNNNEHLNHPSGIHYMDSASPKENLGKGEEVPGSVFGPEGSGTVFVGSSPIPKDILPPRVVLCLGHNGKVAWDVKWRPSSTSFSECKHRLGFLAVLLGDGSLEVWEIPSPRILKTIYLSRKKDSIDPRFVKLKPVFRCSMLRSGDRQSIPLTVEWSKSPPYDLILAGCHDGMVALWKFSASSSSKDTRPMLCFSADTVPIRTLAWAPCEGDTEGGNIIVTAGHEGMKFWDLRDPFRPLWDISSQRFIYSLDWLPDPRCILTSYDDGTLRILSLAKAAYDVPATGKPFTGTPQQGLHTYSCSPFSIWSIQVSPHTGMAAYCGSNGTALYFQLTSKAVDKDPHRNRTPHFLCGSLTDEDGTLVVNTPLPNSPYPMKRSINEWGNTPRSLRGFIYGSNRARRAKEQKADNQPLALCYGEDAGDEESDKPISALKNTKSKTSNAKKAKQNQALPPKDQESSTVKADVNLETGSEIDTMPSKMVALHRVRWNLNKGSQRWLCYGGASGIVRCQEIIPSELGRKGLK